MERVGADVNPRTGVQEPRAPLLLKWEARATRRRRPGSCRRITAIEHTRDTLVARAGTQVGRPTDRRRFARADSYDTPEERIVETELRSVRRQLSRVPGASAYSQVLIYESGF